MTAKYGIYSEKAAKQVRTCIYRKTDGTEVEVTCVVENLEGWKLYNFPDKKLVGMVTDFIRFGSEPVEYMKNER